MASSYEPTDRTTLDRHPERAAYDRPTVHAILDEALIGHLGFADGDSPFVIPMLFARMGDTVYVHGSARSRVLRAAANGQPVCLTITLIDGLVMSRAVFSHSMNYRSVIILGRGREVTDAAEKIAALEATVEHVARGRWADARHPTEQELAATLVVALPLTEVSAKVRTGPPKDRDDDMDRVMWAGEIPLRMTAGPPVDDPALTELPEPVTPPAYAARYRRPGLDD